MREIEFLVTREAVIYYRRSGGQSTTLSESRRWTYEELATSAAARRDLESVFVEAMEAAARPALHG